MLLVIYSNSQISGIPSQSDIEVFTNTNSMDINHLYEDIEKTYIYYLFLDRDTRFLTPDIGNKLIHVLNKYKPAVLVVNSHTKIYHRSVLHYFFPLLSYQRYGESIYDFLQILEYPLRPYVLQLSRVILQLEQGHVKQSKLDKLLLPKIKDPKKVIEELYKWIYPSLKEQKYKSFVDFIFYTGAEEIIYQILDKQLDKINFMNQFDMHQYFYINHKFFENKALKFKQNGREMFGEAGLFHFAHDFGFAQRNNFINHLIKIFQYETYLEIGTNNCNHFNDIKINIRLVSILHLL